MTKKEASEKYRIPMEILEEYEKWNLCSEVKKVMGAWQYDDVDLDRLGMIMTLHDIGFGNTEIEEYMHLYLKGDETAATWSPNDFNIITNTDKEGLVG